MILRYGMIMIHFSELLSNTSVWSVPSEKEGRRKGIWLKGYASRTDMSASSLPIKQLQYEKRFYSYGYNDAIFEILLFDSLIVCFVC